MRNHQQQQDQDQDQETMVSMDSENHPNLETTHNHHHVLSSPSPSSQDLKWKTHQQQHTHISNKTHEDKELIMKNPNYKMIKKPNFLSSSSTTPAGDGCATQLPPPPLPSPSPQDFMKTLHQQHIHVSKKINDNEDFTIKNTNCEVIEKLNFISCSAPAAGAGDMTTPPPPPPPPPPESGRDRLKRHRVEMAGRVRIPDIWGHEDLLKDWIDCTVFDSSLGNNSIMSARAALVKERRRSTLRIQN